MSASGGAAASASRLKSCRKLKLRPRIALVLAFTLGLVALLHLFKLRVSIQEGEDSRTRDELQDDGSGRIAPKHLRLFEPQLRLSSAELAELAEPTTNQLLELEKVNFSRWQTTGGPRNVITCQESAGGALNLHIVINSAALNFGRRARLRATWLNAAHLRRQVCGIDFSSAVARVAAHWQVVEPTEAINQDGRPKNGPIGGGGGGRKMLQRIGRLEWTFVLAQPEGAEPIISRRLAREAATNGDLLLLAGLREHYHNLTLKHLAIYKWLLERRQLNEQRSDSAAAAANELLLKCDDDVQLDLGQLLAEVATSMPSQWGQSDFLACARFPAHSLVQRRRAAKWHLSRAEWPHDTYPAYCSGLAYLSSLGLVQRLYQVAQKLAALPQAGRPLWIDDVYVTGVLPASLPSNSFQLIQLNGHFCYTPTQRQLYGATCLASELEDEETQSFVERENGNEQTSLATHL